MVGRRHPEPNAQAQAVFLFVATGDGRGLTAGLGRSQIWVGGSYALYSPFSYPLGRVDKPRRYGRLGSSIGLRKRLCSLDPKESMRG